MKPGLFITFEGPEGAGKTTQLAMIKAWFDKNNIKAILTREPGGTPLAEQFRDIVKHHQGKEPLTLQTELFLFEAARAQHVQNLIQVALADGVCVICDRFTDSTLAYQGFARGMDIATIEAINTFACGNLKPNLTFLIDLSPEAGMQRAIHRNDPRIKEDRMEKENMTFHQKVRQGYHAIAAQEPERVKIINGDAIPAVVHFDICKILVPYIENYFGKKLK